MWSHFILALSLFATFIECRPEQNNKKLKAAIKENSDEEYDNNHDVDSGYEDEDDGQLIEVHTHFVSFLFYYYCHQKRKKQ